MNVKKGAHDRLDFLSAPDMAQRCLDVAGVIILVLDTRGKISFVNRAGEEALGWGPGELVGKSWFTTCIPRDVRREVRKVFDDVMGSRVYLQERHENTVITNDGQERLIAWRNTILSDPAGTIIGTLSSGEDITERRQAERRIVAVNERLNYLLSSSAVVIYASKTSGNYGGTFISDNVAEMTGYVPREFIDDSDFWINHVHPEDKERISAELPRIFELGLYAYEYRFLHKKGTYIWVRDEMKLVRDERGGPLEIIGCWIDITERKRVEEELIESEEKHRELVENLHDVIFRVDAEGLILYVSPVVQKVFGYRPEEVVGRAFSDFVCADDLPQTSEAFYRGLSEDITSYDLRLIDSGEAIHYVRASARSLHEDGKPTGYTGIITDITGQKLMEQSLRLTQFSVDRATDAVMWVRPDASYFYVNDAACRLLGYTREELLTMSVPDHNPTRPKESWPAYWNELTQKKSLTFEAALRRKDGSMVPVEIAANYLEYGRNAYNCAFIRDITERKRAELALRESEEKYRRIVDTANEGVWTMDEQFVTTFVNPRTAEMLGYPLDELIGRGVDSFMFEEDLADHAEKMEDRRRGVSRRYERRFERKDGTTLWAIISATPLMDEDGRFRGSFAMLSDITEMKQTEERLRTAAQEWRTTFDSIRDMVFIQDADGRIVRTNRVFAETFGVGPEEAVGKNCYELIHGAESPPPLCLLKKIVETGKPAEKEFFEPHLGIYIQFSVAPIMDEQGDLIGSVHILRDTTERKKAEEAIRISEERLRGIAEIVPEAFFIYSLETNRYEYLSPAFEGLFGKSLAEHYQNPGLWYEAVHPDDRDLVSTDIFNELDKGFNTDFRVVRPDGSIRWVFSHAFPVKNETGQIVRLFGANQDITERKQAEEALKESEGRYRSLVDNLPIGVYRNTPGGRGTFIFANNTLLKIFGIASPEDLPTLSPADLYQNPSERKVFSDTLLKKGGVSGVQLRFRKVDGTPIWGSVTARVVYDDDGNPAFFDCTLEDITERKRAQEALSESEERYRALFENATIGIFHSLPGGRLLRVNPALAAMFGYDSPDQMVSATEDIGAQLYVDPKRRSEFITQVIRRGGWSHHKNQYRRKDDSTITVDLKVRPVYGPDGSVIYLEGFAEDVSEKEKMEQQLLQAEKLSSLGGILSGVAHELNNPLTSIIGNAQLLMRKSITEDIREKLEIIQMESLRSSKIIQGLLAFARKHKPERRQIRVNNVIREAYRLREYDLRVSNINMKLELSDHIPPTHADPYQLQQVFINLINNAHDALTEIGGGSLIIRSWIRDGEIAVEFVDDGPGIPKDIQQYIFDPFFTTKEVGKGTGLGLSVAYGIVSEHGGTIGVKSEPGSGATFTIGLPVVAGIDDTRRPIVKRAKKSEGKKAILVVEDEENLRNLISIVLSEEGYDVDACPDGERAIESIKEKEYDGIITDMKMPGISGKDLYTFVQKYYPDQANRILFITGDVLGKETQNFLRITGNRFIEKPFLVEKLLEALAEVLSK
jgi:PAS domain S-box-containing protein